MVKSGPLKRIITTKWLPAFPKRAISLVLKTTKTIIMFTKSIVVAAIVGSAFAAPQPVADPMPDYHILEIRQVASSATALAGSAASACVVPNSILSLITSVPTAPADLTDAILSQTNACKLSFTGSLSSEYKSYSSEAVSWFNANSAALYGWESSFMANCPMATSLIGTSTGVAGVCSTAIASGASAGSSASSTASGKASGSATGTSASGMASGTASGSGSAASASAGSSSSNVTTSNGAAGKAGDANSAVAVGVAAIAGFVAIVSML
ncbi:hypothetical protein BT63DRAFT_416681 [Microthyrium microscopicum]|uniref:Infection structure specific protein n=1 Tax=Microthyrium microscopicum TaxID=703497 RepID=A0A6A6U2Z2_9PEZI|nr:hypothetical protein BT63DRAFT_416681 [Microthyrium microscopicum]